MKIQCLNKISPKGLAIFTDAYEIYNEECAADAILVRSAKMHDMARGAELKAIARAGAGVNNIPIDACSEEGIVVFNTPGANANAVKEMTLAGMLLASRDIVGAIEYAGTLKGQEGISKLVEANKSRFAGYEIQGKTLAVIGLGAIGVMVANAAHSLGMDVIGYDPYLSVNAAWNLSRSVHHANSMQEAIKDADFVSLHIPLNDQTKGSFGADTFAQMKDGAKLMNFSRGEIVDSAALLEALASGKLAKYVVDFPSEEVLGVENVIAIPHLGASTEESEENCAVMAAEQLRDFLENGNIHNSVNFPESDMGKLSTPCRICIAHKNIPNIIGQISRIIAEDNINISDMNNRSRKDMAYTMMDLDEDVDDSVIKDFEAIEGIIRVRRICHCK